VSGPEVWADLDAYVALPRLTGLVSGPDGKLLVSVATLDREATGWSTAWWSVDPTGVDPARVHTRSVEGEGPAAFLPDGRLLFTSSRQVPQTGGAGADAEDQRAIWCLPADGGEAHVLASRSGGWSSLTTARTSSRLLVGADLMTGSTTLAQDQERRVDRRKRKISALLHEGVPVRHWDHDLGPDEPRLLSTEVDVAPEAAHDPTIGSDRLAVLPPANGRHLASAPSLSADGRRAVVTWEVAGPRGVIRSSIALYELDGTPGEDEPAGPPPAAGPGPRSGSTPLDAASPPVRPVGPPRVVAAATDEHDFHTALITPDGQRAVCVREERGSAEEPGDLRLYLVDLATGEGTVLAAEWDRWPTPAVFSADGSVLYVTVDENGHAPVYAVELATSRWRRLTDLGAHTSLCLSWDGRTLYALRSDYTDPGSVVAIDPATGVVTVLRRPVSYPPLPGRLENIEVLASDGARVRGYLLTPTTAAKSAPAPLVLWVHGGPLGSWNSWSWRWCPWLLVAQGYAVLLPDPALSTGYGRAMVARGWTHWGGAPYTDLMTITDLVEQRPDIDATRTAAMGGSFGGYMANWIAGQTDRFRCIVTHASLWDLETFLRTTDAPWAWTVEMTPEMRHRGNPARFADQIRTPMLVVHGDRDYRVPIGEGLGLWWDLVSRHDGPPEELPHKFLYFPEENHWVLTPQHAVVWYQTVLAFLTTHLEGGNFERPAAL